jgi:hypothetical protein
MDAPVFRYDTRRCFYAFLVIAALAALVLWVALVKAMAHSWYPYECCHDMDCAPVDEVAYTAGATYTDNGIKKADGPLMIVTTKVGTAIVPRDLPRRQSQDGRMHACIRNSAQGSYVMCIFLPPAM